MKSMQAADPHADNRSRSDSFARWAFIIGAGFFATTLAQPEVIDLPLQNLLMNDLQLSRQEMAAFMGIGAAPWYFKIVVGIMSDTVPLFGTRRRHYLILSAVFAAALWFLLGLVPRSYMPLLLVVMAINSMLVVGSTVTAGVMVEAGQRLKAAGGLVSARNTVEGFCIVAAGPLAGLLAGLSFEAAAAVGGIIALSVAPVALLWLKEPPTAEYDASVLANAQKELRMLLRSRLVWLAALLFFLMSAPQHFTTPLRFHQRDLALSNDVIGYLKGLSGAGIVLAAFVYGLISKRFSLRALLTAGIACSAIGVFAFVFYDSRSSAIIIEGLAGFLLTFGSLALMEVAIWTTPKTAAAMGFALMMSAWNLGATVGDNVAAFLVDKWSVNFFTMAAIYATGAALLLAAVPFLPARLLTRRASEAEASP